MCAHLACRVYIRGVIEDLIDAGMKYKKLASGTQDPDWSKGFVLRF